MRPTLVFLVVVTIVACSTMTKTPALPPQEEYPLQTNLPINYESALCAQNKSGYPGVHLWQANASDGNINNVLSRWAKLAGWQVKWNSKFDIPVEYPWTINATFDCAINELLRNTQNTSLPLAGQMYLRNKVLLISDAK